jgi:hypothetical protein
MEDRNKGIGKEGRDKEERLRGETGEKRRRERDREEQTHGMRQKGKEKGGEREEGKGENISSAQ